MPTHAPPARFFSVKWIVAETKKLGYESADEFNAAAPTGFEQAASEAQAVGQGDSQDGVDPSSAENPSGAQGGTGSVDSTDIRAEARRVQSVSGAEIIFYTDGDARVGGFTPKSNPELIFIRADRTEIALANSLAHKFVFPVAMAFARRRAHSPEWMAEPQPERPLVLSLRQRLRDQPRELRILPAPPQ